MLTVLLALSLNTVDMYQDRADKNKTIVVIHKDGLMQIFSVDNDNLEKYFFPDEDANDNETKVK